MWLYNRIDLVILTACHRGDIFQHPLVSCYQQIPVAKCARRVILYEYLPVTPSCLAALLCVFLLYFESLVFCIHLFPLNISQREAITSPKIRYISISVEKVTSLPCYDVGCCSMQCFPYWRQDDEHAQLTSYYLKMLVPDIFY